MQTIWALSSRRDYILVMHDYVKTLSSCRELVVARPWRGLSLSPSLSLGPPPLVVPNNPRASALLVFV